MEEYKCTCDRGYEEHRCPFREDVYNECELDDSEVNFCTCCPYCTSQCAMDI